MYPGICPNLNTDHSPLIKLYRRARTLPGIKKVLIASGVRYDLAIESPEYVKELAQHHVGGYLKIAPEAISEGPLSKMMKPGVGTYDRFKALFDKYSKEAGKEQYLIPYFIAAHPGTTDEDMLELALWLKRNGFRADQVQAFLPSPMATATAMYHSGKNPLRKVTRSSEEVHVPKGIRVRRLHKAFLRYHDPNNWPLLREALRRMGRADLIGNGKQHLVPTYQPIGTGRTHEGKRRPKGAPAARTSAVQDPAHRIAAHAQAAEVNSRWGRRLAEVLLFVVIVGGIYAWRTRDLLPAGDRVAAPAFELTDLQGRPWSLDALEGKPAVLYFFAPWCGVCAASAPQLRWFDRWQGDEVQVVLVATRLVELGRTRRVRRAPRVAAARARRRTADRGGLQDPRLPDLLRAGCRRPRRGARLRLHDRARPVAQDARTLSGRHPVVTPQQHDQRANRLERVMV